VGSEIKVVSDEPVTEPVIEPVEEPVEEPILGLDEDEESSTG
jgi:hypothetical protein